MGLDAVELAMAFEDFFHVEIPDGVAGKMERPADVIAFVESQLQQLGIKAKKYREDATFFGDLGAV